jgi:hypothetical protein
MIQSVSQTPNNTPAGTNAVGYGLAGPTISRPARRVRYRVFRTLSLARRSFPKLPLKRRKLSRRFPAQADREGGTLERGTPALTLILLLQSVPMVAIEPTRL